MRRIRLIPALLVFLLSACNENLIDTHLPAGEGEVVFDLSADERVEIVSAKSGSSSELPEVDDFRIEVVNSKGVKFYRAAYDEIKSKTVGFNAGEYTLMAKYGDSLGFGFEKPFYMAKRQFVVEAGKKTTVSAAAKLANVRMTVNYGNQIKEDYKNFYTVIRNEEAKASVRFNADETRSGYIPGGKLTVTVYAPVNGELKCYTLKDTDGNPLLIDANPNDCITFNVNTALNYGDLTIGILIDDTVTLQEKKFDVPADAVSESKPKITLSSFDAEGNFYIKEGTEVEVDDLSFTIKAYAGLKSCVLEIDNDYMEDLGVPATIDFAAQTPEQIEALEDKGFFWQFYGGVGVIDLSGFLPGISGNSLYQGKNSVAASFKLTVTDSTDETVTKTAKILVLPDASATIKIQDYDIWATRLADATVQLTGGNMSRAKVQYSADEKNWIDVRNMNANPFHVNTIAGLQPATKYYLRVLYDDWAPISKVVSFTTEAAPQLGNSGFEDWNTLAWEFNHNGSAGGQSSPMNYYKPWSSTESDIWWDSNTTNSLRPSLTIGYTFFKTFPLVHYSTDAHSGSRSAQLTVVNVGNSNSLIATNGTWYVGELFIGKGNDGSNGDWKKTTEGHAFTSRPQSVTFWYEYDPYSSSDSFIAEAIVKAEDGTVIATGSVSGTSVSQWTEKTLPLTYGVTSKKAATIYISFKASGSSSHSCKNGGHYLEIAGSKDEGDKYRIKLSAALRIDDVTLNY